MAGSSAPALCAACGRPLPVHAGRGRRREYCSATCRSAARRQRQRRDAEPPEPRVNAALTDSVRQDYLDSMSDAAEPAEVMIGRIRATADRVTAELAEPAAGAPLAAVAAARELSSVAAAAMQAAVDRARAAGYSWQEIGEVLETTRQAAFQRFGRPVDPRTGAPMSKATLPDAAERAAGIFADIAAGRYEAARRDFAEQMLDALDASRLASGWVRMASLYGAFERMGEPTALAVGDHTQVRMPLCFEAGEASGRVTFDTAGKVVGLFIRPADRA